MSGIRGPQRGTLASRLLAVSRDGRVFAAQAVDQPGSKASTLS